MPCFLKDNNDAAFEWVKFDRSERDQRNKNAFFLKNVGFPFDHQAKM
jgi:hypothetical protein